MIRQNIKRYNILNFDLQTALDSLRFDNKPLLERKHYFKINEYNMDV